MSRGFLRHTAGALCILVVAACATPTPYKQAATPNGDGYTTQQIEANRFAITVRNMTAEQVGAALRSLEEVREMLDLYDLGDGQATQLTVALARFEAKLVELENRRRDIDRAHADLSHARDVVRARLAHLTGSRA